MRLASLVGQGLAQQARRAFFEDLYLFIVDRQLRTIPTDPATDDDRDWVVRRVGIQPHVVHSHLHRYVRDVHIDLELDVGVIETHRV